MLGTGAPGVAQIALCFTHVHRLLHALARVHAARDCNTPLSIHSTAYVHVGGKLIVHMHPCCECGAQQVVDTAALVTPTCTCTSGPMPRRCTGMQGRNQRRGCPGGPAASARRGEQSQLGATAAESQRQRVVAR